MLFTGNLTVNGTTTTVNSTVMTVDDPVITVGGDTATQHLMMVKIRVLSLDIMIQKQE